MPHFLLDKSSCSSLKDNTFFQFSLCSTVNFLIWNQQSLINHKSTMHTFRKGEAGGSTALLDCTQTRSPWQQIYETQDGMNILISLRQRKDDGEFFVLFFWKKKAQPCAVVALHNTSVFHWSGRSDICDIYVNTVLLNCDHWADKSEEENKPSWLWQVNCSERQGAVCSR